MISVSAEGRKGTTVAMVAEHPKKRQRILKCGMGGMDYC